MKQEDYLRGWLAGYEVAKDAAKALGTDIEHDRKKPKPIGVGLLKKYLEWREKADKLYDPDEGGDVQ